MLTEEHVTQLSNAMVLLDLLDKVKADGHETEELKPSPWIEGMDKRIMKTLDEEEKIRQWIGT